MLYAFFCKDKFVPPRIAGNINCVTQWFLGGWTSHPGNKVTAITIQWLCIMTCNTVSHEIESDPINIRNSVVFVHITVKLFKVKLS